MEQPRQRDLAIDNRRKRERPRHRLERAAGSFAAGASRFVAQARRERGYPIEIAECLCTPSRGPPPWNRLRIARTPSSSPSYDRPAGALRAPSRRWRLSLGRRAAVRSYFRKGRRQSIAVCLTLNARVAVRRRSSIRSPPVFRSSASSQAQPAAATAAPRPATGAPRPPVAATMRPVSRSRSTSDFWPFTRPRPSMATTNRAVVAEPRRSGWVDKWNFNSGFKGANGRRRPDLLRSRTLRPRPPFQRRRRPSLRRARLRRRRISRFRLRTSGTQMRYGGGELRQSVRVDAGR